MSALHYKASHHPRACSTLLAVFVLALGICGEVEIALGAEPVRYQLNIASQPLGRALQEFARTSGVQIIFFSRLTQGRTAPAVSGTHTVDEALRALLAGSALTFRVLNPKTVEIRALPADVTTEARAHEATAGTDEQRAPRDARRSSGRRTDMEEVVVNASAEGLVATRTDTALRAIPQSVSVISQEQMRQQGSTDLADALNRATGITLTRTNSADQKFYARGFEITTFHVDGGAALRSHAESPLLMLGTPDLNEFEHVEVLRGADGLFTTHGNPGGTVNMIRKRPLRNYALSMDASAGSWGQYRFEADLTGPLTDDGRLRGRADALYSQRGYFYDTASLERKKIFAVMEYDLVPQQTLLRVGGSYQRDDAVPFVGGLPFYANGDDTHLPRDTSLTFDWANYRTRIRELYLQVQHEFADRWKVRLNTSSWNGDAEHAYAQFGSAIDPVTHAMRRPPEAAATDRPSLHEQIALDLTLTGSFDWLGQSHELAFGADFARVRAHLILNHYVSYGPALSDIHQPDLSRYPGSPRTLTPPVQYDLDTTQEQTGLFTSWRMYLEDWSVIAGARLNAHHIRTDLILRGGQQSASINRRFGDSDVLTPYAAVTHDLNDHYSLYVSYVDIYHYGNGLRIDGSPIDPTRGINLEAGIKGAWHGGALNGQLALYRISQRNVPVYDSRPSPVRGELACCVFGVTHRSEGVDIELTGLLQPDWLIGAGYVFNRNESGQGGKLSSATPTHLLKLWTSKRLPGELDRWTLGGSVHAQSSYSTSGTYCEQAVGAWCAGPSIGIEAIQREYATLDLRASFDINPNWQLALNVNNIFDKVYYQTLGSSFVNNWYGEPRSAMLRLDGRY